MTTIQMTALAIQEETEMFSKNTSILMFTAVATVMLMTVGLSEDAFAHGRNTQSFDMKDGKERTLSIVLGHTDEPTRAQEDGKWAGEHPVEIFVRDARTNLNISGASLMVDKFFWTDEAAYNADKDPLETDVRAGGVHGVPGKYQARQILAEPGYYGYRVHGDVTYFDGTIVPVDFQATCRDAPDAMKADFNSASFSGGFGCTTDIDDGKFPTSP